MEKMFLSYEIRDMADVDCRQKSNEGTKVLNANREGRPSKQVFGDSQPVICAPRLLKQVPLGQFPFFFLKPVNLC